jgi:DNA-binding PadR family transcriptional regulator
MNPPVFSHGALRLYLLSLLAEGAKHGYELIQAIEQRFGGTYSPSAGTIYPRLSKLEEEGLVTKTTDGRKTVYEITDAGRAELAGRQSELADIEAEVTDSVRRLADEVRSGVNAALKSLRADLASATASAGEHLKPAPQTSADLDAAVAARFALREAELALNDFRGAMRAELRALAQHGALAESAVIRLRAELDRTKREFLGSFNR